MPGRHFVPLSIGVGREFDVVASDRLSGKAPLYTQ